MRLVAFATLPWLLAILPAQAPAPANPADAFAAGLAAVRDAGARGSWTRARS